ncbi:hypothetical protein Patl1_19594 [Pistacia atlantica]|uniref:Uncharacterized protein n=1 Tax=Pistacia atlantica TaxID=434234 RepID=A0ACC1BZY4_9ROSI|nr:hypothetical protein Patl1_19594 [Pistacia atlantica]
MPDAKLGRLSGTEDDLTVEDYEAKLTDINQAEEFVDETGIDALAVCIGNIHGKYAPSGPNLRLDLLKELHALSSKKGVCLVLHGASGLSVELIKGCIERGVTKFYVNTEVRMAYMESLKSPKKDLVHVMAAAKDAMKAVVAEKMYLLVELTVGEVELGCEQGNYEELRFKQCDRKRQQFLRKKKTRSLCNFEKVDDDG